MSVFAQAAGLAFAQAGLPGSPIEPPPPAIHYAACIAFPANMVGDLANVFDRLPTMLPGEWSRAPLTMRERTTLAEVIETTVGRGGFTNSLPEERALSDLLADTAKRLRSGVPLDALARDQTLAFDAAAPMILPALRRSWHDMFVADHLADWRLAAMTTWFIQFKHIQAGRADTGMIQTALQTLQALARIPLTEFIDVQRSPTATPTPLLIENDLVGELMVTRATMLTYRLAPAAVPPALSIAIMRYFKEQPMPRAFKPKGAGKRNTVLLSNSHFVETFYAPATLVSTGDIQCLD